MPIRRIALVLSTAVLAALAPPAGAAAVDVDPDGAAHFAFARGGEHPGVFLRTLSPHGSFPQASGLAGAVYGLEDVQSGADGTQTVMWVEWTPDHRYLLKARRRTPDGALRPAQLVASDVYLHGWDIESPPHPRMAVDAQGGAYFVWLRMRDGKPVVEGRRRRPDGTLSDVQAFGSGAYEMNYPQVGVDAAGNATVTWVRNRLRDVQTRRRSVSGALSAIRTVSRAGEPAQQVRLQVGADGAALFTWLRNANAADPQIAVRARLRHADGSYGPVVDVSAPGDAEWGGHTGSLAPGGGAVFAWDAPGPDWRSKLKARRLDGAGALGPVRTVDGGPFTDARWPQVAVSPQGDAVIAFYDEQEVEVPYILKTRRLRADSSLGSLAEVSTDVEERSVDMDVDANGLATFAWRGYGDGVWDSYMRRRLPSGALTQIVQLDP